MKNPTWCKSEQAIGSSHERGREVTPREMVIALTAGSRQSLTYRIRLTGSPWHLKIKKLIRFRIDRSAKKL